MYAYMYVCKEPKTVCKESKTCGYSFTLCVHMHVRISVCVCVTLKHTYMCVYASIHACMYVYKEPKTCSHSLTHKMSYLCVLTHPKRTYVCIYMHVCMHTCT